MGVRGIQGVVRNPDTRVTDERAGPLPVEFDERAQIDDVAHALAVEQRRDRSVRELLEVVGPDESAERDPAAVARGHAAHVAHVDDAVEV